jgi:3-phosphoshikimate 1-carboxyvinyltransferase
MLSGFGARVAVDGCTVSLTPGGELRGQSVVVPGDISSAAFLIVAGCILPQAQVTIRHVGMNPTRTGLLDVLGAMGAEITPSPDATAHAGEPVGDLTARSARLRGVAVGGDLVPRLIDEAPILAVAATQAEGLTRVGDAAELRVKESDRIRAVTRELGKMGASVVERPDGLEIRGGRKLAGAIVQSSGDHRMAMALVVAGLVAEGETVVEDTACVETSFPGFVDAVNTLAGGPCATLIP